MPAKCGTNQRAWRYKWRGMYYRQKHRKAMPSWRSRDRELAELLDLLMNVAQEARVQQQSKCVAASCKCYEC